MKTKKILIFYGSYGGGHLSAARNIKEYIDLNYQNTETLLVDCIEYINKVLNKVTTKAFAEMAKNANWAWKNIYNKTDENSAISKISSTTNKLLAIKINKLLQDFKPDLIISTHPFSSQMCADLKKQGKINCEIATILTDYAPHREWIINSFFVNYIFVAHEGMKKDLITRGVNKDNIYVTGIPLSTKFLAHYDKNKILLDFNLSTDKKTILFFAGGGQGFASDKTYKMLESLIKSFNNIQIIVISGKNEKVKNQFDELVSKTNSDNHVRILQYTDKVAELMSASDLVITKPGGLTTTECLASRTSNYSY